MKALTIMAHGSTLEEIKRNLDAAYEKAAEMFPTMGEEANCLVDDEFRFEFEFTDNEYIADYIFVE